MFFENTSSWFVIIVVYCWHVVTKHLNLIYSLFRYWLGGKYCIATALSTCP
jgi:hypothetical protein